MSTILFFPVCVLSVRISGVIIKQLLTYLLTLYNISMDVGDIFILYVSLHMVFVNIEVIGKLFLNVMILTHDLAHQGHMTLQSRVISWRLYGLEP